jgi:two-component system, NtrC family, sensor kinase
VDLAGSVMMIVFSFLCLRLVFVLKRHDQDNVIWTYLLMVCLGLTAFAVSRSAGHILKQLLSLAGHKTVWNSIRPFSGAINSFMFVFVASVTLFFERVWIFYQQIAKDKLALQVAHKNLLFMNQNLEARVAERTEALTFSEHKYRRIFEVSRAMILVARKNGSIEDINPSGRRMLGFDESDPLPTGHRFQDFCADPSDWDRLKSTLIQKSFVPGTEIDFKGMDGVVIPTLVSASSDRSAADQSEAIHFIIKDIQERRSMEKQMAQADKLASIGQLSAGVAHEINNPLNIILGYTQLLLRSNGNEEERYNDLETIEKHVKNCRSIVQDLLNFARSSDPKRQSIRIHETIEDVLNIIRHHSDSGGVEIIAEYDKNAPAMLLDEKKIKQVFMNLIMNARHAVGKTGTIRIGTQYEPSTQSVTIQVQDTGYGIEKKNLSKVFDPFFTTKPTGEGTGLGLSVSYGIIKNHGGDIFVESIPRGKTTFTVVLPLEKTGRKEAHETTDIGN